MTVRSTGGNTEQMKVVSDTTHRRTARGATPGGLVGRARATTTPLTAGFWQAEAGTQPFSGCSSNPPYDESTRPNSAEVGR